MGRIAWQVGHQTAKNSTSCGRPVEARYLGSLLRNPLTSAQVLTGAALAGLATGAVGATVGPAGDDGADVGATAACVGAATVAGGCVGAGGGAALPAHALTSNTTTKLRQVLGFYGDDATGAPREITPKPGDTFTVMEKWLDLDQRGNVVKTALQKGETLTFGDQPWKWKELDAAAGEYVVGFIVEDLDGNPQPVFEQIVVR